MTTSLIQTATELVRHMKKDAVAINRESWSALQYIVDVSDQSEESIAEADKRYNAAVAEFSKINSGIVDMEVYIDALTWYARQTPVDREAMSVLSTRLCSMCARFGTKYAHKP